MKVIDKSFSSEIIMATQGFFAVAPSGFVPSASYYVPYVITAVTGGWNSGMLNTSDGSVVIPSTGIWQTNVSFVIEHNNLVNKEYVVDLIVEIDGTESRMRCQQTITNNDLNTIVLTGALSLTEGQLVKIKLTTNNFVPSQVLTSGYKGSYFSMVKM